MQLVLDIETTLDHGTIRLVGVRGFKGDKIGQGRYFSDCVAFREFLEEYAEDIDVLYTYYGEGFDYDVLTKVWGIDIRQIAQDADIKLVDLYIVSKIIDPDRVSHSLASWMQEVCGDQPKLEVDYDNAPLDELQVYLERDLYGTCRVAQHMNTILKQRRALGENIKTPLRMETQVRRIQNQIRDVGFNFDAQKAEQVREQIQQEMQVLESEAPWLPWMPIPESRVKKPPKKQFLKTGEPSALILKYLEANNVSIDDVKLPLTEPLEAKEQITLSDHKRLKDYALSLGWKPTLFNEKGNPMLVDRITKEPCKNLKEVFQDGWIEQICEYSMLKSRLGTLQGYLDRQREGRLHGDADTCGTPTARFKHRVIVNVPRVGSAYGAEFRSFFVPDQERVQVGWDASSLEAVMEAHEVYPYDQAYAEEILNGDIHTKNQENLGLPSRAVAKTFKYAITYGAQPDTLAKSLNVPFVTAVAWFEEFWEDNQGLTQLMQEIHQEWGYFDKKCILGIDGRLLSTRKEHALLNTKLQGGGAILMKYSFAIAYKKLKDMAIPLIMYHDEMQVQCRPEDAEEVARIGVWSIEEAGRLLKLRVPITGEAKIGNSWSECH